VVVKKNCFCVFSILMFGEEAVCPDGLFVPVVFREVRFYLNSHITIPFCCTLTSYSSGSAFGTQNDETNGSPCFCLQ
jgi:hypothetical protein